MMKLSAYKKKRRREKEKKKRERERERGTFFPFMNTHSRINTACATSYQLNIFVFIVQLWYGGSLY